MPALPRALCASQVVTSLVAEQAVEGQGRASPGQGLPFPGPCLWVRLGQTALSHPMAWRKGKMFQAQAQERSQPWQGDATSPVLGLLPCPAGPVCPVEVAASPWELVWDALARR